MTGPQNRAGSALHAPEVLHTRTGTPYLARPGVLVLAQTSFDPTALSPFVEAFPGLASVLEDPVSLAAGAGLCKTAGQLCYMSFGARRTANADAARYFANILRSGHGSVLEHACYTLLVYGISRSVTHEIVRHRAGFAFSQVSQRYVTAQVLRFVERPEFQSDPELHAAFEQRIDRVSAEYRRLQEALSALQRAGADRLAAEAATDRRKRIQQAARALLPNEAEAPMIVTGNVRAWRHFIEMRASEHADIEIRGLAHTVLVCLRELEPLLFSDYVERRLADGSTAVHTETPKV